MIENPVVSLELEFENDGDFGTTMQTSCGVGSMIATGIFSFTGLVYATVSGPSVVVSFFIAGIAAALSATVYSEFAVSSARNLLQIVEP